MADNGIEKIVHVRNWATDDAQETATSTTGVTVQLGAPPPGYLWDVTTLTVAVPGDAGPWLAVVYAGSPNAPEHAIAVGRSQAGDPALVFDTPRDCLVQSGELVSVTVSGYASATATVRARMRVRVIEAEETTWPAPATPVTVVGFHPEADALVSIPLEAVDG